MKVRTLKANEIQTRVGNTGKFGVNLLLYTDARIVADILDECVGAENWQDEYKDIKGSLFCGIGVYNDKKNEFIYKWDCGTESNTEKEKGQSSDAFKRAAVKWGIARELYKGPKVFIKCPTKEEKDQYGNSKYSLPKTGEAYRMILNAEVKEVEYDEDRNITKLVLTSTYKDDNDQWHNDEVIYSFGKDAPKTAPKQEPKKEEVKEPPKATMKDVSTKITKGGTDYLAELIKRTKTDQGKLLEHYGVTSLDEMTMGAFEECSKILESRLS